MKISLSLLFCIFTFTLFAQEGSEKKFTPKLNGSIMTGNSYIPKAFEGSKAVVVIPTWGFDAEYIFHPHWAVGIQNDIKLQSFEIEGANELKLQRNFPISIAVLGYYKTNKHWSFLLGPGIELERTENLFIAKVGTEYTFEISERFEISLSMMYENREEVYDGVTFGISFTTPLWKKKN